MKKKQVNYLAYLPIAVLIFSLVGGWFKFTALAENTAKETEAVKKDVKEVKEQTTKEIKEVKEKTELKIEDTQEKLTEAEKINLQQTILIQTISETLSKLNDKMDKKKWASY